MARTDWAFDVQGHFEQYYADSLGFVPDEEQQYVLDRITGTIYGVTSGNPDVRGVVIPRAVGFDNADRFRRWVTVDKTHWGAMTARPNNWRVFILMIGLLPDGQPWWSTLYEESTLAASRDHSEEMGGFYRFDPGLTGPAKIAEWDRDRPEPKPFRVVLKDGDTEAFADPFSLWEALRATADLADEGPDHGIVKVEHGQLTLDFDSILAADLSAGAKKPSKAKAAASR